MRSPGFRILVLSAGLRLICHTAGAAQSPAGIADLIPPPECIAPWNLQDDPQCFEGEDLYLFIDGGAEIYHEFGFRQALSATFTASGGHAINVEIYKMEDGHGAFGMYTVRRGKNGEPVSAGTDGTLESYYLNFWKDRYLVTLIALDTNPVTTEGLTRLARAISGRIPGSCARPSLYAIVKGTLPPEYRITYVEGPLALGTRLSVSGIVPEPFDRAVIAETDSVQVALLECSDSRPDTAVPGGSSACKPSNRNNRWRIVTKGRHVIAASDSAATASTVRALIRAVSEERPDS